MQVVSHRNVVERGVLRVTATRFNNMEVHLYVRERASDLFSLLIELTAEEAESLCLWLIESESSGETLKKITGGIE